MAESKLRALSLDFAISITEFCDTIKGRSAITNQMMRSGTSIGANVFEANYAQSRGDFISKLQIALKEYYETEYWLEILYRTSSISESDYMEKRNACGQIRRILISSIKTAKENTP